jgi:hypothetical protein
VDTRSRVVATIIVVLVIGSLLFSTLLVIFAPDGL